MDAENIARLCGGLSIKEKEKLVSRLDSKLKDGGEHRLALCLVGKVREIDIETTSDGSGRFLRVRVTVQANEPLQRSIRVDLFGTGKVTTILLRYERLLNYCFKCSRLGNMMEECTDEEFKEEMLSEANRRRTYEDWRGKGKMATEDGSDDWNKVVGRVCGEQEMKGVSESSGKGTGFDKEGYKELGEMGISDRGMVAVLTEGAQMDEIGEFRALDFIGPSGSTHKQTVAEAGMDKGPPNPTIQAQYGLVSGFEFGNKRNKGSGPPVVKANIATQGIIGNKKMGKWKRIGKEDIRESRQEILGKKLGKRNSGDLIERSVLECKKVRILPISLYNKEEEVENSRYQNLEEKIEVDEEVHKVSESEDSYRVSDVTPERVSTEAKQGSNSEISTGQPHLAHRNQ
ncbi:hypothetical protein LWI28_024969 [Acer negundo]|uniref:Zinc knuckle CX2CX4HX4C domain-containing protein n=1 Tax=Acer negundo TaxID=4023 RepID=A0AAD5I7H0_ACENE|nr:hypothetical protein LWI28_024969 [Acer negundo]